MLNNLSRSHKIIRKQLWFYLPMVSVFVLTIGNGFYITLSTIHLSNILGTTSGHLGKITNHSLIVGIISSCYFSGIISGSYFPRRTLSRIGYIQAFALYSMIIALITMLQTLTDSLIAWMFIRFAVGYAIGALFLIIESWFLSYGSPRKRGFIYACYLCTYYTAQALGQLLLELPSEPNRLYSIVSASYLVAALIFCVMSTPNIKVHQEQVKASLMKLIQHSPLSCYTALSYGIFMAVVYSMLPYFAIIESFTKHEISVLMLITILGGTFPQFIIGYFVDNYDKYLCLYVLSIILLCTIFSSMLSTENIVLFYIFSFLYGACGFSLYSISVAISVEDMPRENTVSTISMVLVTFSIGTVVGPLLCSAWMHLQGSHGYFYTLIAVVSVITLLSYGKREPEPDAVIGTDS